MAKVIAIINQKGGVGKTTTAVNFGACLAARGFKILFVDMDPQCNMSYSIGGEYDNEETILEVLTREVQPGQAVQHLKGYDLIGGSSNLSQLQNILTEGGNEFRLRETLAPIRDIYDYVIIDSPPALGLITVNILVACTSFIITANADIFSMQGIGQLYNTASVVKSYCNPDLKIDGVLLTKYAGRMIYSRAARKEIEEMAGEIESKVFKTIIREAVVVRESQNAQKDLLKYAPKSKPAQDYIDFTNEYLKG